MEAVHEQVETYIATPVEELTTAECLLLMCTRLWKMQHVCRANCPADWRGGLCAAGIAEIADDVVDPLLHIMYGQGRLVDIQPLRCRQIKTMESNLLNCVALIQNQRLEEAETALNKMLSRLDTKAAIPLVKRLAYTFLLAKLYLPVRQGFPNVCPSQDGTLVH